MPFQSEDDLDKENLNRLYMEDESIPNEYKNNKQSVNNYAQNSNTI